MSKSQELRTKAAHYRELATMLDSETAEICRTLADQYDEEAAAEDGLDGQPVQHARPEGG